MKTISWLAAGALALAVGCASSNTSGSGTSTAPPGTATAPHPAVGGPVATASGTIQNYTTGPGGQQDGFTLASGQRVHFSESMGSKVSDQFPPNTAVKVEGHMTKDAEGRPVLEADTISAPDRNAKLDLTAGAASPSPSSAPAVGGSGTGGSQPATPPTEPRPVSPSTPSQPMTPSTPPGGR